MKAMYNTMIVNDMEESVAFYKDICGFEIDSVYDLPNTLMWNLSRTMSMKSATIQLEWMWRILKRK